MIKDHKAWTDSLLAEVHEYLQECEESGVDPKVLLDLLTGSDLIDVAAEELCKLLEVDRSKDYCSPEYNLVWATIVYVLASPDIRNTFLKVRETWKGYPSDPVE